MGLITAIMYRIARNLHPRQWRINGHIIGVLYSALSDILEYKQI